MKVKPFDFLMAIIFFAIGIDIFIQQESPPWWFAGTITLGVALDYIIRATEKS